MKTIDKILNAITVLPTDLDELSYLLAREGHYGYPKECDSCPLVDYFQTVTGIENFKIDRSYIEGWNKDGRSTLVKTPLHLASFIGLFDHGIAYDFLALPTN